MNKLFFFWGELKSTFWFIPVLMIVIAIGMALGFLYWDNHLEIKQDGIAAFLFVGSSDSARIILSTISGAMITVAGTVFSITLVALTLASSQFGPRLIRNFMYDRINQVVLGSYISTYIYCLIVLNTITGEDQTGYIPALSILVALIAALANIILLIVFIHHIAVSIQAGKVTSGITKTLFKNIQTLYPEKLGVESEEEQEVKEALVKSNFKFSTTMSVHENGYLQYVDHDSLVKVVSQLNSLFEIHHRPGSYIVKGEALGMFYTDHLLNDPVIKKIQSNFIMGESRTLQQDTEHSIHQMVEIASRALSPGINDPYTTIACIDNLTSIMSYLSSVRLPSKYRYDKNERLVIIAETLTFEGMLDAAFNQIRQFSKNSPAVVIRLMEALVTIDRLATSNRHKKALKKHAEMVLNMAENSFSEPNDLKDLKERSRLISGL
ncbi:MAG: DUF2254 domain-containing protein [Balneolaceae bacterium]